MSKGDVPDIEFICILQLILYKYYQHTITAYPFPPLPPFPDVTPAPPPPPLFKTVYVPEFGVGVA